MNIRLFWQLQISHVGGVLLPWVIQFAALTQSLVVDRQGHGVHVHQLVVGDSGLAGEDGEQEERFALSPPAHWAEGTDGGVVWLASVCFWL